MINVEQVPVRDWTLYFGGVYMQYKGHIVFVSPVAYNGHEDGRNRTVLKVQYPRYVRKEEEYLYLKRDLQELGVWWPRAGAYNYKGTAVYVSRRATRSMKKSCCPDSHYYLKWGRGGQVTRYLTQQNHRHIPWPEAQRMLKDGVATAVAITRNLIVTPHANGVTLIYRGDDVGTLDGQDFVPHNDLAPTTKLVYQELIEERIV